MALSNALRARFAASYLAYTHATVNKHSDLGWIIAVLSRFDDDTGPSLSGRNSFSNVLNDSREFVITLENAECCFSFRFHAYPSNRFCVAR